MKFSQLKVGMKVKLNCDHPNIHWFSASIRSQPDTFWELHSYSVSFNSFNIKSPCGVDNAISSMDYIKEVKGYFSSNGTG